MGVVHTFELEGMRNTHASQLTAADERHHEHMERERRAHREHVAALEDAQRARDSREDYLKAEVDRLTAAAGGGGGGVVVGVGGGGGGSDAGRALRGARRHQGLSGSDEAAMNDGTLQDALVEEAAAQEALASAMRSLAAAGEAASNAPDDAAEAHVALKEAEAHTALCRVRLERATWKRMAKEAQAVGRRQEDEMEQLDADVEAMRGRLEDERALREHAEASAAQLKAALEAAMAAAERGEPIDRAAMSASLNEASSPPPITGRASPGSSVGGGRASPGRAGSSSPSPALASGGTAAGSSSPSSALASGVAAAGSSSPSSALASGVAAGEGAGGTDGDVEAALREEVRLLSEELARERGNAAQQMAEYEAYQRSQRALSLQQQQQLDEYRRNHAELQGRQEASYHEYTERGSPDAAGYTQYEAEQAELMQSQQAQYQQYRDEQARLQQHKEDQYQQYVGEDGGYIGGQAGGSYGGASGTATSARAPGGRASPPMVPTEGGPLDMGANASAGALQRRQPTDETDGRKAGDLPTFEGAPPPAKPHRAADHKSAVSVLSGGSSNKRGGRRGSASGPTAPEVGPPSLGPPTAAPPAYSPPPVETPDGYIGPANTPDVLEFAPAAAPGGGGPAGAHPPPPPAEGSSDELPQLRAAYADLRADYEHLSTERIADAARHEREMEALRSQLLDARGALQGAHEAGRAAARAEGVGVEDGGHEGSMEEEEEDVEADGDEGEEGDGWDRFVARQEEDVEKAAQEAAAAEAAGGLQPGQFLSSPQAAADGAETAGGVSLAGRKKGGGGGLGLRSQMEIRLDEKDTKNSARVRRPQFNETAEGKMVKHNLVDKRGDAHAPAKQQLVEKPAEPRDVSSGGGAARSPAEGVEHGEVSRLKHALQVAKRDRERLQAQVDDQLREAAEAKELQERKAVGNRFMYSIMQARLRKAQESFTTQLTSTRERAAADAGSLARDAEEARKHLEDELAQLRAQDLAKSKHIELLEKELQRVLEGRDDEDDVLTPASGADVAVPSGVVLAADLERKLVEKEQQIRLKEGTILEVQEHLGTAREARRVAEGKVEELTDTMGELSAQLADAKLFATRARRGSSNAIKQLEQMPDARAIHREVELEAHLQDAVHREAARDRNMTEALKAQKQLDVLRPQIRELGTSLYALLASATDPSTQAVLRDPVGSRIDATRQLETDAKGLLNTIAGSPRGARKGKGSKIMPTLPNLSPRGVLANIAREAHGEDVDIAANGWGGEGGGDDVADGGSGGEADAYTDALVPADGGFLTEAGKDMAAEDLKPRSTIQLSDAGGKSYAPESAEASLRAISEWSSTPHAKLDDLLPLLAEAVHAIGMTISAVNANAKAVMRRALEASHEHSKALLSNVSSMITRDEQMRHERSDAAMAMLETKMQLLAMQQQLSQPMLTGGERAGGLTAAQAEEAMNGGGGLTRALHTLTKRMLDAQEKWERKKVAVETARADDFDHVLSSLKNVLSAAQGAPPPPPGPPVQRTEFLNRGSSVINRQLALHKGNLFPAPPPTQSGGNAPSPRTRGSFLADATDAVVSVGPAVALTTNGRSGPEHEASPRRARSRAGTGVKTGAGEAIGFFSMPPPPPTAPAYGGKLVLKADAVTELAGMARLGDANTARQPQALLNKMSGGGHEHLLFAPQSAAMGMGAGSGGAALEAIAAHRSAMRKRFTPLPPTAGQ